MMLFCYFITKYIYKFKFISIRDSVFAFKQYQNYTFFHKVFKYKATDHFWFMNFFMTILKKTFPKELLQENTSFNSKVLKSELFDIFCIFEWHKSFPKDLRMSSFLHPSCCHLKMANKLKWEMSCKCSPGRSVYKHTHKKSFKHVYKVCALIWQMKQ